MIVIIRIILSRILFLLDTNYLIPYYSIPNPIAIKYELHCSMLIIILFISNSIRYELSIKTECLVLFYGEWNS